MRGDNCPRIMNWNYVYINTNLFVFILLRDYAQISKKMNILDNSIN